MSDFIDKTKSLMPHAFDIIFNKATERPFSSQSTNKNIYGTYLCRRCGLALFRSQHTFDSGCGWPSFDDEIKNSIKEQQDADGHRIEIICSRCMAHLGHVFRGEYMTHKNLRHCVNGASIDFVHSTNVMDTEEIIVAGGCFWGVEYYLNQLEGVVKAESGYIGGKTEYPSYEEVCTGKTNHYEAVRVVYDKHKVSLKAVLTLFFEIHNPEQANGQGADIGSQYQSAVFYYHDSQRLLAESLLTDLINKGFQPATKLLPVSVFWPAESYHQQYYQHKGGVPYCHRYVKRF